MADEIVVDGAPEGQTPESTDSTPAAQTKQYTSRELEAIEMGWRPQEEWTGDPDDFVSAKEFVQRKSFYDRISTQTKEIKELRSTIDEFKKHHEKLDEHARKAVLADLKAQKARALEEGNTQALVDVDEALVQYKIAEKERLEEQEKKQKQVQENPELNPIFVEWKSKNSWYNTDAELTKYANVLANGYVAANPGIDPNEVLAYVSKETKARFKDKFENLNRKKPTAVEGSSGGKPVVSDKYDLSDEERKIAQRFVRQGLYKSIDDYAKDLQKMAKGER